MTFEKLAAVSGKASPAKPKKDTHPGKTTIMGWFDPVVKEILDEVAHEQRTTKAAMLREALNDLFAKYDKERVA